MKIKKELIIAVLATFCLTATLFIIIPTKSQSGYDPWTDINGDGTIDMADISMAIDGFMTTGTPITKAGMMYDSGWINITGKCGQGFAIDHNLGSSDLTVEVTGKRYEDWGPHQICYGLVSQPGWRKLYGDKTLGYQDEFANCIINTKDGGYAIAGSRLIQSSPTTDYDVLLVKTDSTGDVEWIKTYGGSYNDYGNSVIEASDGGYVIAGCTDNSGGNPQLYLIKTDMRGNLLWNTIGANPYSIGVWNDVIEVSDGYVAAGFVSSLPKRSAFCAKFDKSTGNVPLVYQSVDLKDTMFSSVVATSDGNLAFAGTNDNFVGMPHAAWWVKTGTDIIFPLLGEKAYNATSSQDVIDDIIPISTNFDGGYVLAGSAYNVANKQGGWLIRVNDTGDVTWDRKYSGSYECHFNSVVAAGDCCTVFGIYWDSVTSGALTAQIDHYGNLIWRKVDDQTVIWNKVCGTAGDGYVFAAHAPTADYRCFVVRKVDLLLGLEWYYTSSTSVLLLRGTTDSAWNFVRVRIWKAQESP